MYKYSKLKEKERRGSFTKIQHYHSLKPEINSDWPTTTHFWLCNNCFLSQCLQKENMGRQASPGLWAVSLCSSSKVTLLGENTCDLLPLHMISFFITQRQIRKAAVVHRNHPLNKVKINDKIEFPLCLIFIYLYSIINELPKEAAH